MTAAPGPSGSSGFSMFSSQGYGLYRSKREVFLWSMLGQALVVGLLAYFISDGLRGSPPTGGIRPRIKDLPLIFAGRGGAGGGNMEKTAASFGARPRTSMGEPLAVPTVIVPNETPRLPVEPTVMAPEIAVPSGPVGDPASQIRGLLSAGRGKDGIGDDCCAGVGNHKRPVVGSGPGGPGFGGAAMTAPRLIFNPEPGFSDEARKSKTQGAVLLLLVVGADGRAYDIHVQSSLGMGLDEKAVEAVRRWRFAPATVNGQAVARQIAVEVNFHLY
jgi:periplasmic protein TonB